MCFSQLLAMAFALSSVTATAQPHDAKPIEIPLKEIWALEIPGTRDVRELDPPRTKQPETVEEFIKTSLVEHISVSLGPGYLPKVGNSAGRGFIVAGSDLDALREAHAVLAEKKKRAEYIPAGKSLTLVFYTFASGRYVHLDEVTRNGDTITVKYYLVPPPKRSRHHSAHLALIPLGELTAGKMRVRITKVPNPEPDDTGFPPLDPGALRRTVCDSFSFIVAAKPE